MNGTRGHRNVSRKDAKAAKIGEELKIICQTFFITLAPLRLGGKISDSECLTIADHLRKPRKFRSIIVRRTRSSGELREFTAC